MWAGPRVPLGRRRGNGGRGAALLCAVPPAVHAPWPHQDYAVAGGHLTTLRQEGEDAEKGYREDVEDWGMVQSPDLFMIVCYSLMLIHLPPLYSFPVYF